MGGGSSRETLRLRSVWTRETGDVMWKEGLAGRGDLAETFFDLHIAYKVEMSLDLSHISFVVNF